MKIIKAVLKKDVIMPLISALGALISAMLAGCRLYCGELAVKDFEAEIFGQYNVNTNLMEIKK